MTRSVDRPYPGARPFSVTESDRFFGRAAEAVHLAELWRSNRLTIIHGPAGSGKTSFLQAGVLPLVERHIDAEILHRGIEIFFHDAGQAVNLVDK